MKTALALVCMLLILLLIACSSASATATPEPTSKPEPTASRTLPMETIIEIEALGIWEGEARAWIDENKNGKWDNSEKPLAKVNFLVDIVMESGQIGLSDSATSNQDGAAYLSDSFVTTSRGGQCVYGCVKDWIVRSTVPEGLQRTTPGRIRDSDHRGGPFFFGFTYIDTPIPEPASTPSP